MVQHKVAAEEQKRFQLISRINEYDVAIAQAFRDQQSLMSEKSLDLSGLKGFPDYLWRLKQERFQIAQALQVQEQKLRNVREELKQALIKKQSLEILKDKDLARYRKRLEKIEEEFLSELALRRATQRSVTA